MSQDNLPVPWEPAEGPAQKPYDIKSVFKIPVERAMAMVNKGFDCNAKYHEANASKEQTKALRTLNRHIPQLREDVHSYLGSGSAQHRAVKCSVKEMAASFDRLTDAHTQAARSVQKDAATASSAVSSSAAAVKKAAEKMIPDVHGVRLAMESLGISVAIIAVLMNQMLDEVRIMSGHLGGIREELWRSNLLTSSGGSGKDGFAEVVHNFVAMEAAKEQFANDHFFVWNPDTSWHPAFYAKLRQSPLPSTFRGESDSLDRLCVAMRALRQAFREQDGNGTSAPSPATFHILMPSWYNINMTESLHFPDYILPLRLVGATHDGGNPLVTFVLPRPQLGLTLHGVGNAYEEKSLCPTAANIVVGASAVTACLGSFAGGCATAVAVAAAGPLAPLAYVIVAGSGIAMAMPVLGKLEAALIDEPPRILGSHERLPLE
ncbi:hypothetical protein PWT90_08624 [Aphanocladium album]|nr:hypothetical protein PWT90_08624 [Aphanocladium album]